MAHRVYVRSERGFTVLELQGLLDRSALAALRSAATTARGPVRVVLGAATEVDRACLAELRALAVEIVADSPYLARWLSDCRCTPPVRS